MTNLRCASAILLLTATGLAGQTPHAGPPAFKWVEVVPGIYATIEPRALALSPFVHGNQLFVVNEHDVFAVDANHTPSAARVTLGQLRQVTKLPIRRLLITHWHGDHNMGTEAFVNENPDVEVIATDSTRDDFLKIMMHPKVPRDAAYYARTNARYDSLAAAGKDLADRPLTPARKAQWEETRRQFREYYSVESPTIKLIAPTIAFAGSMKVFSGSRELDILSFAHGDTRADAVLWLPKERVVATGDILVEPAPYSGAEWPSEWLKALRAIRALNPLHIVPGHGEVMHDTRYLDLVIAATDSVITAVHAAAAAGKTLEQVHKELTMDAFRMRFTGGDPATEDRWSDFLDGLIDGAYAEVKKA